jgi:hypothetical protein
MPEPSTLHIGKGVALVAQGSNSRVHIALISSDSSQSDKFLRNIFCPWRWKAGGQVRGEMGVAAKGMYECSAEKAGCDEEDGML